MAHLSPGPHLPSRVQPDGGEPQWPPGLTVSVSGEVDAIQVLLYNANPNTYEVSVDVPGQGTVPQTVSAIPNSEAGYELPTTYRIPVPPGVYECFVSVLASAATDNIVYSATFSDLVVTGGTDNGAGGSKYPNKPIKFE
jgi:hypothetical protein